MIMLNSFTNDVDYCANANKFTQLFSSNTGKNIGYTVD